MVATKALRTLSVMLVKALRCCVNSKSVSTSSDVRSEGSFSKHSLTASRTNRLVSSSSSSYFHEIKTNFVLSMKFLKDF